MRCPVTLSVPRQDTRKPQMYLRETRRGATAVHPRELLIRTSATNRPTAPTEQAARSSPRAGHTALLGLLVKLRAVGAISAPCPRPSEVRCARTSSPNARWLRVAPRVWSRAWTGRPSRGPRSRGRHGRSGRRYELTAAGRIRLRADRRFRATLVRALARSRN